MVSIASLIKRAVFLGALLVLCGVLNGCAYRMGMAGRTLPQGHRNVAIPMFDNGTYQHGIEVEFTNALIHEIQRSGVANVVSKENAEVVLKGTIVSINVGQLSVRDVESNDDVVIFGGYRLIATVNLELVRKSDRKIIWAAQIQGLREYDAPRITLPQLTTANPLYDLSARRETLKQIALDTSTKAFDRLTENF